MLLCRCYLRNDLWDAILYTRLLIGLEIEIGQLIFFLKKGKFYYWQRNSESPYSSLKLIRHPRLFCTSKQYRAGVPPPPSTGSLQLLCQCFFQAHVGSSKQHCNWLVRSPHADTLASRPAASCCWWLAPRPPKFKLRIQLFTEFHNYCHWAYIKPVYAAVLVLTYAFVSSWCRIVGLCCNEDMPLSHRDVGL